MHKEDGALFPEKFIKEGIMYYDSGDFLQFIIIFMLISIVVFFICREIICWYFKINARLDQQRQTNVLLEKIYHEFCIRNGSPVQAVSEVQTNSVAAISASTASANRAVSGSALSSVSFNKPAVRPANNELDYERLLSMSVQQLTDRGMLELEDHHWEAANAYFSEALNKEPHNGEAHLGLLLAEQRRSDVDRWLNDIRGKYCCELSQTCVETVEVIKDFDEHVRVQEETYELKGYLSREEIREQYSGIEHSYHSSVNGWTRRMESFKAMVNARYFRRVLRYSEGSLNQKITHTLEETVNYMNLQFEAAIRQDKDNFDRINTSAPRLIEEADSRVRNMGTQARNRKEEVKRNRKEKISRGFSSTKEQIGSLWRNAK